jgi:hypothetical protein
MYGQRRFVNLQKKIFLATLDDLFTFCTEIPRIEKIFLDFCKSLPSILANISKIKWMNGDGILGQTEQDLILDDLSEFAMQMKISKIDFFTFCDFTH